MRILIINPNTSNVTNIRIRGIVEPLIHAPDEIEVVSAQSGIKFIETIVQSMSTVPAVLDLVKMRHESVDAIIIAAFSDPGLCEARAIAACPVLGISEAAMKTAARMANRFSIITLGPQLCEVIYENATNYGVAEQLTEIRVLPWTVAKVSSDPSAHKKAFADACESFVSEQDIGAVIIGGGPLSGIADAIAGDLPIPVLDGVRCAVDMALELYRQEIHT